MGVFDCLIDNGSEPKVGMEYIYNFDMAWPIYNDNDKRLSSFASGKSDEIYISSQEELDNLSFQPYSIKVKNGILVTNVVSLKHPTEGYHRGYDFTIKESGIRCHCNYPWAFWENTPENMIKIEKYRIEQQKLDIQEKFVNGLRDGIDKLTIKD